MHPTYKVLSFKIIAPYKLYLSFDDGTNRIINFKNVLKGDLYGSLSDIEYFNQVKIDEEINTIVWPNDADFDPLTLHDWDLYEKEMQMLINSWD
jgi:hypothetical protein